MNIKHLCFSFEWQNFNSKIIVTEQKTELSLIYIDRYFTLNVEEQIESLEYDAGTYWTAAGGNLGLFLGFSSLSVLFAIFEYVQQYIG